MGKAKKKAKKKKAAKKKAKKKAAKKKAKKAIVVAADEEVDFESADAPTANHALKSLKQDEHHSNTMQVFNRMVHTYADSAPPSQWRQKKLPTQVKMDVDNAIAEAI